jgi:hypothetical protein
VTIAGIADVLALEIERKRLDVPLELGLWEPSEFERSHQAGQLAELLNQTTNETLKELNSELAKV